MTHWSKCPILRGSQPGESGQWITPGLSVPGHPDLYGRVRSPYPSSSHSQVDGRPKDFAKIFVRFLRKFPWILTQEEIFSL